MGDKTIAERGRNTRFTSENQPENRGKKPGSKNRATVAKYVLALPSNALDPKGQGLRITDPDTGNEIILDVETAMAIRVAARSIASGDPSAYQALMDSAYGKPKGDTQAVAVQGNDIDLARLSNDELATFKQLLYKAKGLHPDGTQVHRDGITDAEITA